MINWVDVSVLVEITSLLGVKLSDEAGSTAVRFDVTAKLEEKERQSGRVVVLFGLIVRTKPNVAKYELEGKATLAGKDAAISRVLSVDSESKVPFILHRIYQHAFTAIYTLASFTGAIYPPPDLLMSKKQEVLVEGPRKTEPTGPSVEAQPNQTVKPQETTAPVATAAPA